MQKFIKRHTSYEGGSYVGSYVLYFEFKILSLGVKSATIFAFGSGRVKPRVTSGGVCQRRLRHDFSNMHASIISLESKFANASYGYAADSTSLQNYRTIHMNVFAWRMTHSCSPNIGPGVVHRFDGPANSCSVIGKQCDLVFPRARSREGDGIFRLREDKLV